MAMPEIRNGLQELRRMIRPGGKVLFSVSFSEHDTTVVEDISFFHPVQDIDGAIREAGWSDVESTSGPPRFQCSHNWFLVQRR